MKKCTIEENFLSTERYVLYSTENQKSIAIGITAGIKSTEQQVLPIKQLLLWKPNDLEIIWFNLDVEHLNLFLKKLNSGFYNIS